MKIKRITALCALMAAMILLLCACGGKSPDVTEPDVTDPTAATVPTDTTPRETLPEEPASLEELYEKTDIENVFLLDTISTEGYSVQNAFLRDGYVLLLMRDFSEQGVQDELGIQHILDSGKVVLFPINQPDAMVSLSLDRFTSYYTLLSGGNVLEIGWDGGYTLYNSRLEAVDTDFAGMSALLGESEQGDIWFLAEDSSFVLYRDGRQFRSEPVEGMMSGKYIGCCDGKAYFQLYNYFYGWTYSSVDLLSMKYEQLRTLNDSFDMGDGLIGYSSEDKWYIAGVSDPFTVTAFTKPYSNETAWRMDERFLIGTVYNYNPTTDSGWHDCHIYDMRNGGLCGQISGHAFSGCEINLLDYEQELVLFETRDDMLASKGLYLWNLSGMTAAAGADVYETIDYHVDEARIQEMIRQIYDQYGVTVYYDAEHLKEYSTGYDLIACTDIERIGYTLIQLQECMAEYPEGFFREIKAQNITDVVFCLCDDHDRTDADSIEDAAATVTTIRDTLRMSIDVHYWLGLRRIFLHENTHMMETRLEQEMGKISSRHYVEYWYNEMNRPDCPPIQHYIWEQTDENMKGVYGMDPEDPCYIDWYSKCTIGEDHARIMENGIYSGSAHYYSAHYIDLKSRFLNAMIREAFPCVQNAEHVFWEQRTGAVDLRQEFPDFADR